jgi:LppP/LprE lipoprotein
MDAMRPPGLGTRASCLTAGLCCAALLGACGSGSTKTVTVSSAPLTPVTPVHTTPSTSTSTQPSTPSSPTTTNGGASAPSTTRSAPEPAFTQHESSAPQGASAAAAAVRAKGYTPNDTAEYHSNQTLRVLVGTRAGSGDGYGQRAFFFVDGRFIGTDATEPSATVRVAAQSDTEVTLVYPLYRKNDPLSSPSGGQATVRFTLNNGKLTPLGPIPPASSASGLSRQ